MMSALREQLFRFAGLPNAPTLRLSKAPNTAADAFRDGEEYGEPISTSSARTMQMLGGHSQSISGNLLAMDALNQDYAQAAGALDDRALMYVHEMGRRARERLLLYHYYIKKAYEYRLLRPYTARLELNRLFDRFRTLGEQSSGEYQQLTVL